VSDGACIIVESAKGLSCRSVNEEAGKVCGGVVITVMGILTFTALTIFILIGQSCRSEYVLFFVLWFQEGKSELPGLCPPQIQLLGWGKR